MVYQRIQRGRGLGGFLKPLFNLFRRVAPLASKAVHSPLARNIGREVAKAGLNVTADAISGNNISDSTSMEVDKARRRVGAALKRASTILESTSMKKMKTSNSKNSRGGKKKHSKKVNARGGNLF